MVRHAQRVDETPQAREWFSQCGKDMYHDPPITRLGHQQARGAGAVLANTHSLAGTVVMTSPLQRCVETASHIALALQSPLQVVNGLGECAAAIRCRLAEKRFIDDEHVAKIVPSQVQILRRDQQSSSFESTMLRLSETMLNTATPPQSEKPLHIIVVTHREGLGMVSKMCTPPHPHEFYEYCAIRHFSCHTEAATLAHTPAPTPAPPTSTPSIATSTTVWRPWSFENHNKSMSTRKGTLTGKAPDHDSQDHDTQSSKPPPASTPPRSYGRGGERELQPWP